MENNNVQENQNQANEGVQVLQVTSLDKLKEYAQGQLIQLPAFSNGQPFVARLRRPSMLALVKSGKIPNSLMVTANQLFKQGGEGMDTQDEEMLSNVFKVMDALCEASFVEPKYQDIKNAGIELTDDQMMFVFNYSQAGVKALETFHQ